MTFITTTLLGAAILFIASSLDNTPITVTFQKIISGQKIDWTGNNPVTPSQPPDAKGQCPDGWILYNGMCYQTHVLQ